ncbi:MAG: peptide chain release factor N(5)-glutamine methyltransferase [bacterium]
MKDTSAKNLLEILKLSTKYLSEHGIENPRLNAERLMAHVLNFSRVQLYLNYERPLQEDELTGFRALLKRRAKHEPLQYIVGETEFMSLPFKVNPAVLIPRPETEILVEKTIEISKEKFDSQRELNILDIGTGSGNIAVSLAKNLLNATITAIDVSADALKIASENALGNGVEDKIEFHKFDFLGSDFVKESAEKFDVIISNPPYVSEKEFQQLPDEVRSYEPLGALKDGSNGVVFFHKIAEISHKLLTDNGFVAVEVGMGQAPSVMDIFRKNNFAHIQLLKDLNGIERVVFGEF